MLLYWYFYFSEGFEYLERCSEVNRWGRWWIWSVKAIDLSVGFSTLDSSTVSTVKTFMEHESNMDLSFIPSFIHSFIQTLVKASRTRGQYLDILSK